MWPFKQRPGNMPHPSLPDTPLGRQLGEIYGGLKHLRDTGRIRDVFGAGSHKFELNPPLTEGEVAAFERKHKISLPADYRAFLIHLGNGGAGPYYGLFKLGEADTGHGGGWQDPAWLIGDLAQPFPHTAAWNQRSGAPECDEAQALALPNAEFDAYQEQLDAWEQAHYWHARQHCGSVPICHVGCVLMERLVITGPEAGHVWCDRRVDREGLYPLQLPDRERVTFLEWYLHWLREALEGKTAV
jgi:hypothetical protein